MRLLAVIVVMLSIAPSRSADARRFVISDPPMVRRCPTFRTWNQVMTCLGQHYTPKLAKEVKGAKLVTLFTKAGSTPPIDTGLLLYVERGGNWQLGGRYESGGDYTVLSFAPVTIGRRSGYRLDIGHVTPISLMVDAVAVMGTHRIHHAMFCSGDSYVCPDATVSCDLSIDGNAWYVFRGTLSFEENIVNIAGDRERTGPYCNANPKLYLGWVTK